MAAWAVTQTTRFKAAVSGAPVIDMASEFGTENGSAYDEWFYGTPYEKLDGFIKSSPITFVKNVEDADAAAAGRGRHDRSDRPEPAVLPRAEALRRRTATSCSIRASRTGCARRSTWSID